MALGRNKTNLTQKQARQAAITARKNAADKIKMLAAKKGGTYTGIPIVSTGIQDLLLQEPLLDMQNNLNQYEHEQNLTDLGVVLGKKGRIRESKNTPFGAYQQGERSAMYSSADRGFGRGGTMARATFEPLKQDIALQANRSRENVRNQDSEARIAFSQQVARAYAAAPAFALQNEAWGPGRKK